MKNLIENVLSENFFLEGLTYDEVREYFSKEPDVINGDKWIYFIEKCFLGIRTKKLHLHFCDGIVYDFYIG